MIKWNDKYLLGIEIIDNQHKELFRLANDGYDLLNNKLYLDKYDNVIKIIEKLKDYAAYHFQTEENYMMEIGYERLFSHKVVHNDFIKQIKGIDLDMVHDNQEEYLSSILVFVVDWIEQHILKMDRQYLNK